MVHVVICMLGLINELYKYYFKWTRSTQNVKETGLCFNVTYSRYLSINTIKQRFTTLLHLGGIHSILIIVLLYCIVFK
jgi:hypothetical protein